MHDDISTINVSGGSIFYDSFVSLSGDLMYGEIYI